MVSAEEKELLAERFVTGNLYKLKHLTAMVQPEELAELINESPHIDVLKVFQVLDPEKAVKTFEHLDFERQEALLLSFSVVRRQGNSAEPDFRRANGILLSNDPDGAA